MLGRERVSATLSPAESQDRTRLDCEVRSCFVPHARRIVMERRVSELRGILIPMTLAKFGKALEMKRQSGPKRAKVVKFSGAVSGTTAVPQIADDFLHRQSRP